MPQRYSESLVGKYRIGRFLGAGAFAWVFEATDLDLEIPVALKILRPEFVGQDQVVSRFRREATLAARLRHPNIVAVRDVGQIGETVFVAMDLHPLTLGRRLELATRIPEAEVVLIGTGVAAALAVAHEQKIVHRDIKPDNILIDRNGEAVVADFGLARALSSSAGTSATSQVLGTPHYFSPEQARGLELDGRSDLYSLGATLYRAATGSVPFDGSDWYAVARHHIESPPRPPRELNPDLSSEFEAVVLKLLAKDPANRFETATQVVDALLSLPSAPAVRSPARSLSHTVDVPPIADSSRAKRNALLSIASVLVLAGAAVGINYWNKAHPSGGMPSAEPAVPFADSSRTEVPPADSTSVDQSPQPEAPTPRPASAPRQHAPEPAEVRVVSSPQAELYVNNRLVGNGSWQGDHPVTQPLRVRAVLPSASVDCETASRDTIVSDISSGERVVLNLPVRDCVTVSYRIQPRDARVVFRPLDGGSARQLRADSAESMSLPIGRYLLRISAPRCSTFEDTVVISPTSGASAISRRLICS